MDKRSAQKGFVAHPALIIAAIVALLIVFLYYIGALKLNFTVGKTATAQPKTYQNDQAGISLTFPASWTYKENLDENIIVGFLSPLDKDDKFSENVLVKKVDLSQQPGITLQRGADLLIEQTKGSYSSGDFQVVSQAPTTVAGAPAHQIVYLAKDQEIDGKVMATITLKNNTAYIFIYTAEAKSFDKFANDASSIVASLKVK